MVRPFWLLNSSLLALCGCTLLLIYTMRVAIPGREDIEPILYSTKNKEQNVAINIRHIYENDLFGTYKKQAIEKAPPEQLEEVPHAPIPQKIFVPEPIKPTFLEPLNITLKGIIMVSSDESKNSALISDNKTDQETTYTIGDTVQDAQLMRIFNNKIILLRNNGQQEVLYLREHDAKTDPAFTQAQQWQVAVQRDDSTHFTIFPLPFIKRVENLSRFIEMLSLTTAYQKGEPVGARIGVITPESLGFFLGFMPGDIILSINDIPTTTIQNRTNIYNQIISLVLPASIHVTFLRGGRTMEFFYHVEEFKQELIPIKSSAPLKETPGAAGNVNSTEAKYFYEYNNEENDYSPSFDDDIFAQVQKEIRKRESTHMLAHGS